MLKRLLLVVAVVLAGCGTPAAVGQGLPPILMTSGGGFSGESQSWTISPAGAWTMTSTDPPRQGVLTDQQRHDLAALANDPALRRELRSKPGPCDRSDGDEERLEVGEDRYLAGWCGDVPRHITAFREQIKTLTVRP